MRIFLRGASLIQKRAGSWASRGLAVLLIPGQVLLAVPAQAWPWPAAATSTADGVTGAPPPGPPEVKVNRTAPKVSAPAAYPVFSESPTEDEIFRARVFGEPLVPVGGPATTSENEALAQAVGAFLRDRSGQRMAALEAFLEQHAGSPWRASLLMNLGILYRRSAYFTRAEKALREAWELSRDGETRNERAVGDRALVELFEMHGSFGQILALEELLALVEDRPLIGAASLARDHAKASVWGLTHNHEQAIPSGPVGLGRIRERLVGTAAHPELAAFHATMEGATLVEMRDLASRAGLKLRIAIRQPGAKIPVPALMHLKQAHFSAVVAEEGAGYRLDDPLLGGDIWMSQEALEEESTGFFLIREGPLPKGWTKAEDLLAADIRGKCKWPFPELGQTGDNNPPVGGQPGKPGSGGGNPGSGPCTGLATYRFHRLLASVHVEDIPVGYTAPRGPGVGFRAIYNQKEFYQPLTFTFANLGNQWLFDWVSYVEDNPANLNATAYLFPRGGGRHVLSNFDGQSYGPHRDTQEVVSRISTSPIRYERRLPDGSKEVFTQSDGAMSSPRRTFMTEAIDPQGNALTFIYDAQLRLVSVTDAIGQVTTLSYELGDDPLKVTKVTDPFGRSATLTYNSDGRLASITDVIGMKSEFSYGYGGDFMTTLTTPYGTTTFAWGMGPNNLMTDYWAEATDPMGGKERLGYGVGSAIPPTEPPDTVPPGFAPANIFMNGYTGYYFDKRAMALYPEDYTKARIFRWNNASTYSVWDSTGSEKLPLENRVWYEYASAPFIHGVGPMNKPIKVARVLDDGSAQIYQYEYNTLGKVTREIDPLGREKVYTYDTNQIDLLNVKVKNGAGWDTVQSYTYNSQHQPLTVTDAAGQVTTYTYNAQGQVLTVVTPPRAGLSQAQRTTTYAYDTNGLLQSVTGPLAGATTGYTYDGHGRVRTVTDSDSYTLTYDYDALDRPTRTTYADTTYEETMYNRLDPEKQRDRVGRWTLVFYDALRRAVATRDPLGRTTTQQWCDCGSLDKLVDASGNTTSWERDSQGRKTKEIRSDGSVWETTYETTTSRVKKVRDAKAQDTQYAYFLDGQLQQVSHPNAQIATPSVSYTYDTAYGRLATRVDATGTTSYSYHPVGVLGAGRRATLDGPLTNDTITYGYEELGRRASRTLNGATTTWSYDALGRLTTLADPLGNFTPAHVGVTGRLSSLTYPNGQASTYTYLPNSGDKRLQEIHHRTSSGGSTLSKFTYAYDTGGNVTQWTQQYGTAAANAYDLGYDAAEQLVSAIYRTTDPTPVVLKRYGYVYDPAGNRTTEQIDDAPMQSTFDNRNRLTFRQPGGALLFTGSVNEPATMTIAGTAAVVDAANKFEGTAPVGGGTSNVVVTATDPSGNLRTNTYQVTVSGGSKTFTYDANGSLTAEATKTYEWDGANRLVRVLDSGNEVLRFVYDGEGRRSQKITAGVTRTYVYDGEDIVEERLSTGATIRYLPGPGIDRPLAKVEAGAASYYLADHLASIVQITDATAMVTVTRQYDPWGNLLQGSSAEGYAYTGREWDPESSLHYYRARYYSSEAGRFISEDPIGFGDGSNLFAYARNNPTNLVDPSGRVSWKCEVSMTSAGWGILGGIDLDAVCECCDKAKQPKKVDIDGKGWGVTFPSPFTNTTSKFTLYDDNEEPDEKVFEGSWKYVGAGAAAVKGGSASLLMQIGKARSWYDAGPYEGSKNLDLSVNLIGGPVTEVKVIP